MQFLIPFIKKEWRWGLLCLFFMVIGSVFTISQALLIANVTTFTINLESAKEEKLLETNELNGELNDENLWHRTYNTFIILFEKGNKAAVDYVLKFRSLPFIILLGGVALLFIAFTQIILFMRDFANQYIAYRIANRIRIYFLDHTISLPTTVFKNKKSGEFVSRGINDIKIIESEIFPFLESAFFGPILSVIGLTTLFIINLEFSLILIVTIAILGFLVQFIASLLKNIVRSVQEQLTDLTHHLQEVVYFMEIIKIFNREKYERLKFWNKSTRIIQLLKKQTLIHYLNRPMTEILMAGGIITIIFISAKMIWQNEINLTEMFSFFAVLLYITPYMQRMGNAFFLKQKISVSCQRIEEITKQFPTEAPITPIFSSPFTSANTLDDPLKNNPLANYQGGVDIKNLSFSFEPNQLILNNITLSATPGEFIAIVGESGSGKTTLLNLIASLLQPTGGTIYYEDTPHNELPLSIIRDQMSLVSQESLLFPATIRENILYGNLEADEETFQEAVHLAAVHTFVEKMPLGYETEIGERGIKISGGQRQRICIARALIKKPKILLFDEATSALDSQSEKSIQESIAKLRHKQTIFVIAHRLSTIFGADKIIVIDQGKIESIGNHQELLKKSPIYSNLHKLQFR